MPIEDLKPFYPRLGRITAGYVAAKRTTKGIVTYPTRSETFVFSGDDRKRLEVVARVLGGKVEPSPDPRAEGRFRVITSAKEIEVFLPSDDERGWDSWWELWGSSGCLRRCNGVRCLFAVDPETGERQESIDCVCKALGLQRSDPNHCRPVSRLNVVVPALADAPGLGIWQVTSRGISTYLSIQAAVDLARKFGPITGVPLLLRIVLNRRVDRASGEVRIFPTILLTVEESYVEAFKRRIEVGVAPEALPQPDRERAPLGAVPAPEGEELPEEPPEPAPSEEEWVPPEEPPEEEVFPDEDEEVVPGRPAATPPASVQARRDYTAFWKAVRGAAAAEGDSDPYAWLERVSGKRSPIELSDADYQVVLHMAEAAAKGKAKTGGPIRKGTAKAARPERAEEPRLSAELISRMADQLRRRAREAGVSDGELLSIVAAASGNGSATIEEALQKAGYAAYSEAYRVLTRRRS